MNDQHKSSEHHTGTLSFEPEFVISADECPTEGQIRDWVVTHLGRGQGNELEQFLATLQSLLEEHGKAEIFSTVQPSEPPKLESTALVVTFGEYYVARPPRPRSDQP
ncbi:MAG: hypothetical protein NTX53_10060 [candidate division WOR-3 bacterium]|nr:hypothetical protein [candidate division WOR-3 bacterium]